MSKTHVFITDAHAKPGDTNRRALLASKLIAEVRPDIVIVGGDTGDFEALCSYDKGTKAFEGRTYKRDVDAHNDFQDKLWHYVRKAKKKMPTRVTLIGNHEQRIARAINIQPELDGIIGYGDLDLDRYYDVVVDYNGATPGTVLLDGVCYAHYLVSGIAGRAIGGEHSASSLLAKQFASCSVGHSHLLDYSVKTRNDGRKIMGLVGGCFFNSEPDYAGEANKLRWTGMVVKRQVENGTYDPEFVSMRRLEKMYPDVR